MINGFQDYTQLQAANRAADIKELNKGGKPNIRRVQSRGVYVIYSGKNYTNLESFESRSAAQEFIDDLLSN